MARQKKIEVTYGTSTLAEARALVKRTAKSFRAWSGKEGDQTTAAAVALAEARHAGYLYTGPASERPSEATTLAGYAEMFGVTRAVTTFWSTLAEAYTRGVATDSDLWKILCNGKAARVSAISKAIKADGSTPAAIAAVVKGEGWTVDRQGKVQHATRQGQGARNSTGRDADEAEETPVDLLAATGEALKVIEAAIKASAYTPEQWEAVDRNMARVLRAGRKAYGLDPRTGKPVETPATGTDG